MNKFFRKAMDQRERELLLGNLVTWGSIVSAVALAIAFVPILTSEAEHNALTSSVEAQSLDIYANQG
ncbi:hypothetical protein [Sphingorhabdus sp. SMR4y]|uniref:hypothetical protein n=1 Tax=Sphingorhabdus sp. SMR4y TaxID=2584094 RepID=UPI000B5EE852|nr:hypothetical protein [Sphingorhabdus sp. SMR4y]ASK88312.1 hypothetical protein SPHFLASMR4Y_01564 [Sphingorhabdus sp. SMR4y]